MKNEQVVLTGFMGSGKSTVARELARELNYQAIDLDQLITEREKRTPKDIIEQLGEKKFRDIETRVLGEVLAEAPARVIAVGGGAFTIAANRELIAAYRAFTVWLDAPFDLCWERIEEGVDDRPLARSREMAQKLYADRRHVYQLADARVIVAETESAVDTARQIARVVLQQNAHS
jgi:shikimate kinase